MNKIAKRIKVKRGMYLIQRGEAWYLETCKNGVQKRICIETVNTRETSRRVTSARAIAFVPTTQVKSLLDRLLATGLYGFSIEEVIDRLLCSKLIEISKSTLANKSD
jgi:hypothetical protein